MQTQEFQVHLGDYASVDPDIAERDARPRVRLPLDQVAFGGTWGRSWR